MRTFVLELDVRRAAGSAILRRRRHVHLVVEQLRLLLREVDEHLTTDSGASNDANIFYLINDSTRAVLPERAPGARLGEPDFQGVNEPERQGHFVPRSKIASCVLIFLEHTDEDWSQPHTHTHPSLAHLIERRLADGVVLDAESLSDRLQLAECPRQGQVGGGELVLQHAVVPFLESGGRERRLDAVHERLQIWVLPRHPQDHSVAVSEPGECVLRCESRGSCMKFTICLKRSLGSSCSL